VRLLDGEDRQCKHSTVPAQTRWTDSIGELGGTPETIAPAGQKMTLSPLAPCAPSPPAELDVNDPLSGRRHQVQRNDHGGRGRSRTALQCVNGLLPDL